MHRVLFAMYRKEVMSARGLRRPLPRQRTSRSRGAFPGLRQYDVFPVVGDEGPDAFA